MSQRWKRLRWKTSGGTNISKISKQCHSGAWGSNLPLNSADAAWIGFVILSACSGARHVGPPQSIPAPLPHSLHSVTANCEDFVTQSSDIDCYSFLSSKLFPPSCDARRLIRVGTELFCQGGSYWHKGVTLSTVEHSHLCVCVCVFFPHCIDASVDFHEITSPLWPKG